MHIDPSPVLLLLTMTGNPLDRAAVVIDAIVVPTGSFSGFLQTQSFPLFFLFFILFQYLIEITIFPITSLDTNGA